MQRAAVLLVLAFSTATFSLDNGLMRTPPMGWLAWERYRCDTDCQNDPDNCIRYSVLVCLFTHVLSYTLSSHFSLPQWEVIHGYGWQVVWGRLERVGLRLRQHRWLLVLNAERRTGSTSGWPQEVVMSSDPVSAASETRSSLIWWYCVTRRFPGGIAKLARYVHDRGLKLGIYGDMGTHTCGGYPGTTLDKVQIDAQTFAEWGIDMLKLDGCYSNSTYQEQGERSRID